MTTIALPKGQWVQIAPQGATVEVQISSVTRVRLTVASSAPTLGGVGEALGFEDRYRKFDAPLPANLYAMATVADNSAEVTPIGSAVPAAAQPVGAPSTFFAKRIALTGSPIQLPANALVNGLIGFADPNNASRVYYGPSAAAVTAIDGSGDGFPVLPGASVAEALSNSNAVWVNGAAGTLFFVKGN